MEFFCLCLKYSFPKNTANRTDAIYDNGIPYGYRYLSDFAIGVYPTTPSC